LLAGFIQMAFYSIIFYIIYFLYKGKLTSPPVRWRSIIKNMAFFVLLFSLIGCAQVLLSLPLVAASSRDGATLGFALWRSFSPAGLLGLLFPFAALVVDSSLYIGVMSIFMVILALLHTRRHTAFRPIVLILVLSFMCALGRFNPLYVLALKATHFYSFRNPSKFLFFSGFALSVLAGYGFSLFVSGLEGSLAQRALKIFRRILICAGGFFLAAGGILLLFRDQLKDFGQWYVIRFVFGRPHHRHELSYYTGGVERLLVQLTQSFSLASPYTIASWIFLAIGFFFVGALLRRKMKAALFFLIVLDLFIFSFYGTGFRGNIAPFSYLAPSHQKLYGYIKSDTGRFRVLPFGIAGGKLPNWAMPNAQMIYGLESVGLYTPLAPKHYHDALSPFEVVDDSLGVLNPREEVFRTHQDALSMLNVKYVLSDQALSIDTLEYIMQEDGIYLYRYKDFFGRLFFTRSLQVPLAPAAAVITIDRENDGIVTFAVSAESDGFIVLSQMPYPGWRVFLNRQEVAPVNVGGLAQAVSVPKGTSIVTFEFHWHDSFKQS
ncbi:MAG: hypothetical protein KKF80_06850, partial [Candidatus Omnitrophica bacterium]|nr:hypothetical protein [Candidatus Omnitrophota bacterium]